MAFVRTKKGNWDGVYEPSASVLNSLGKITAVQKKGHNASIKDLSTEELVDIMEESFLSVREEGQVKRRMLRNMVVGRAFVGGGHAVGETPITESYGCVKRLTTFYFHF
ncbi:hypothetical protein FOZ62_027760 [Perkinsus olseni]|uniref:Uncharacterized protein n=1 Tax=Perkinsus olseni TaxID=32597 RepID=A0A7J6UGS4_PEROL|nr:hypothetical protein FOZ62_027760 [Perkinsus olseni]